MPIPKSMTKITTELILSVVFMSDLLLDCDCVSGADGKTSLSANPSPAAVGMCEETGKEAMQRRARVVHAWVTEHRTQKSGFTRPFNKHRVTTNDIAA